MYSKNKVLMTLVKTTWCHQGIYWIVVVIDSITWSAIRGAGDILGKEQSGFIDALGLDMYMKYWLKQLWNLERTTTTTKQKTFDIEISKHVSKSLC